MDAGGGDEGEERCPRARGHANILMRKLANDSGEERESSGVELLLTTESVNLLQGEDAWCRGPVFESL